jgi:hypothetical protein
MRPYDRHRKGSFIMISILLIILVVLWALGIALSYTFGGFIHVLLLVAIVGVVFRMINEQHPLRG